MPEKIWILGFVSHFISHQVLPRPMSEVKKGFKKSVEVVPLGKALPTREL